MNAKEIAMWASLRQTPSVRFKNWEYVAMRRGIAQYMHMLEKDPALLDAVFAESNRYQRQLIYKAQDWYASGGIPLRKQQVYKPFSKMARAATKRLKENLKVYRAEQGAEQLHLDSTKAELAVIHRSGARRYKRMNQLMNGYRDAIERIYFLEFAILSTCQKISKLNKVK